MEGEDGVSVADQDGIPVGVEDGVPVADDAGPAPDGVPVAVADDDDGEPGDVDGCGTPELAPGLTLGTATPGSGSGGGALDGWAAREPAAPGAAANASGASGAMIVVPGCATTDR